VGYLSKIGKKLNIRTKPVLVHNKTTKLAVLFAIAGAMIIVVPMLVEHVNALTTGSAACSGNNEPPFTNLVAKLEKGKWKVQPKLLDNGCRIEWQTAGSGVFGGTEFGTITADFGGGGKVSFIWFNPDGDEKNGCGIKWTGKLRAWCQILTPAGVTSGPFAIAKYLVSQDCEGRFSGCTENGSVNQDSRSPLDDSPMIIIGDSGSDRIIGGFGNDRLDGEGGQDILIGGYGKDLLIGGTGNDELTGGPGPDTFVCGPGIDKITDFKQSEGDKKTSDCEQF
jgi:hypothetical protein